MGNTDDVKAVKPEKLSSPPPPPDQSNIHVYPDWAAMQAYYGPRVAVPPYFNPAVASGQAPHPYMWGPPQPVMPPYGVPYAALYAHGGVYAHPGVPLGTSPVSMDAHVRSSGTTEHGLMKKLKGLDDLVMSIGNGKADSSEGGMERTLSQSKETEGSSDGSNENSKKAAVSGRKRGRDEAQAPNMTGEVKIETQSSIIPSPRATSEKLVGITVAAPMVAGKVAGTVVSHSMTSSLEVKDSPKEHAVNSPAGGQQPSTMMPNDSWLHNERDLKRERRKQSNRESARRSRLRKQAEAEELAIKVDSLTAENMALKAEINRLTVTAEKLTNDNSRLLEVMKNAQAEQAADVGLGNNNEKKASTLSTANLLSRVDNAGCGDRDEGEGEVYEKTTKSGAKLHQLLDANPRTDAVAAV